MKKATTLDDLIGIEHCKLGFYQELQQKVEQLRNSNQQLEEKRKENQALLDGITDMMIVLSSDLIIQRVNHVFYDWHPGVDPIGSHCHQVLHGSSSQCDECPALNALYSGEVVKDYKIYKVDGKYRHYEIIASPLRKEKDSPPQVLLFKRDVTLEKEYQAQFYQAEKMATLGTLTAGVAHEINNPLAAIDGFAQGLKRRLNDIDREFDDNSRASFAEYLNTIIKECGRCRNIVTTLLTFSNPVASRKGPVDCNGCIRETLFILKHHFKQYQHINITTRLSADLPYIQGDESQLKQVIINLLTNGCDAITDDGEITISTVAEPDGGVSISIRDNGCGIPLENQDKLFEPFFTTKTIGKGIGVGLSTCYSIVNNHGGEIKVESVPGEGSTFHVFLPGIGK